MNISYGSSRRVAVRPSPVFLLIAAVTVVSGSYLWRAGGGEAVRSDGIAAFVFVVSGWLVSLCLHEFMHAFLAWRFGDREVEARGYLTLNPFKYTHALLSFVLPVLFIAMGGIGLPGGAVYLHTGLISSRVRRAMVSLAGPAVNVVCAAVLLYALRSGDQAHWMFWEALAFLAFLQLTASVLNLLPVPGLDGYGMIEPYLSRESQSAFGQFKPYGLLGVFLLLQVQQLNTAFFNAIYRIFELSGVSRIAAQGGYELIRFWQH
jgi:Zn-dependent protease